MGRDGGAVSARATNWLHHNQEFLRNLAVNDIGRIDTSVGTRSRDHNDANLEAITDHAEKGEATLVNVIQFKRAARILDPGNKPLYQV